MQTLPAVLQQFITNTCVLCEHDVTNDIASEPYTILRSDVDANGNEITEAEHVILCGDCVVSMHEDMVEYVGNEEWEHELVYA